MIPDIVGPQVNAVPASWKPSSRTNRIANKAIAATYYTNLPTQPWLSFAWKALHTYAADEGWVGLLLVMYE